MTRTDIMDKAKEIQTDWVAMGNEWIKNDLRKVQWDSDNPGHGHVTDKGHFKKEIPDEFQYKIHSFLGTLTEDFAPTNSIATDELRLLFNGHKEEGGGMKNVDWQKCDDQTFPVWIIRKLVLQGIPIPPHNDKKSWNKFQEVFGAVIADATRTKIESAEYHRGKANLAEWREGGCQ